MKMLWGCLGIWFAAAFTLAVLVPPPAASAQIRLLAIAGPIVALVLMVAVVPTFQRLMRRIPLRALLWLHVLRLPIGALFLLLAPLGLLPYDFSWPAGVGDMIAGGMALAIVALFRRSAIPPMLLGAWNIIGLLDFINVQRVAVVLGGAGRGAELIAMQGPPLALVPYFAVPLLFFTHLYMLGRLARQDRRLFVDPVAPRTT
jgi:hypothetical protein